MPIDDAVKRQRRLNALFIFAITWVVYSNSVSCGFVGDDYLVAVNNRMIRSWSNWPQLFSKQYLTTDASLKFEGVKNIGSGEASYRPVVTLSYFIDRALWGLRAGGYHWTSVSLHALCAFFLYFLFMEFGAGIGQALLAALFFGLHPVNTEAVNVISYREDLLALLFAAVSFLAYRKAVKSERKNSFAAVTSWFFYLLALFSKESAIVFPLLIAADAWLLGNGRGSDEIKRRLWKGFFICTALYLAAWFYIGNISEMVFAPRGGVWTHCFTALKAFGIYISWVFFPVDIHIWLPEPTFYEPSVFSWGVAAGILFFLGGILLFVRLRNTHRGAAYGLAWFYVALLPVSGIIPTRHVLAARYLYFPMAGMAFFFSEAAKYAYGALKKWLGPASRKRIRSLGFLSLCVFLASLTMARGLTFRNNTYFWREAAKVSPNNGTVRLVIAGNLMEHGDTDGAIREFQAALRLNAEPAWANQGLGMCYFTKGDFKKAVYHLQTAVGLNPYDLDAYVRLGSALGECGDYEGSVAVFRKLLERDPKNRYAWSNLATTYARMGRLDRAQEAWKKFKEIKRPAG